MGQARAPYSGMWRSQPRMTCLWCSRNPLHLWGKRSARLWREMHSASGKGEGRNRIFTSQALIIVLLTRFEAVEAGPQWTCFGSEKMCRTRDSIRLSREGSGNRKPRALSDTPNRTLEHRWQNLLFLSKKSRPVCCHTCPRAPTFFTLSAVTATATPFFCSYLIHLSGRRQQTPLLFSLAPTIIHLLLPHHCYLRVD